MIKLSVAKNINDGLIISTDGAIKFEPESSLTIGAQAYSAEYDNSFGPSFIVVFGIANQAKTLACAAYVCSRYNINLVIEAENNFQIHTNTSTNEINVCFPLSRDQVMELHQRYLDAYKTLSQCG
ncbi:hypothetical protein [Vibrio sp. VB16]|uniref:hypothetical protein n=1 Tax=Vibrio sp. VB16 TaxID=2785746 RepID=UPI00189EE2F2|nr:hypothetical protein [Vibrio sp. VB16]UGA53718.1 hypothetical protein IUZ65_010475 [Vibrio sp. VB16]